MDMTLYYFHYATEGNLSNVKPIFLKRDSRATLDSVFLLNEALVPCDSEETCRGGKMLKYMLLQS